MPRGRVLAVDDQRYFRELIEGMLVDEGFEVQTAGSGEEALAILDQTSFDVIVTDLVMPIMSGNELVQKVREREPEQDIVVVTGVVDVRSAVDAMKVGATDYLLKPFDGPSLAASLDAILQRRATAAERDRLLEENIEYLGEQSLFARALTLFRGVSAEGVGQRTLDALCEETGAQGGVLWLANEVDWRLCSARGLVRVEEEPEQIDPAAIEASLRAGATTALTGSDAGGPGQSVLWVAMRHGARLSGVARLTDKAGGDGFDDVDRACAEKFMQFAEAAFSNADRFQQLEQRMLQDPETGAYHVDYLRGVVRNEIEKANRFGRSFGLIKLELTGLEGLRAARGHTEFTQWLADVTRYLARQLRSTDLIAAEGGVFWAVIAETDALGIASFKQRVHDALERSELMAAVDGPARPEIALGAVTCPGDSAQLESLLRLLDERTQRCGRNRVRDLELDSRSLSECFQHMLSSGEPESPEGPASIVRFALGELGRRPRERNLFFFHPGEAYTGAMRTWLDERRGGDYATDVVVIANSPGPAYADDGVVWVSPERLADCPPFVLHFGDGPPYVMVCADKSDGEGLRLFHAGDRGLVEHLAFRLQRELGVPRIA
jgi:diguanylate cyclase (GGDEF)-like protein